MRRRSHRAGPPTPPGFESPRARAYAASSAPHRVREPVTHPRADVGERGPELRIEGFDPAKAAELVAMWRASFEFGVGIVDPHPIAEQVAFLLDRLAPANTLRVATLGGRIAGFSASTADCVAALYVHVEHLGQGIGSELLRLAKADSSGSLWLYTFARNLRARRFYERRGFAAVAHGFEPTWQLEDVRYEWVRTSHPT